ncbi:MAG: energy transducer TonB [Candidatus Eremiobacteraeota bacterium]|nr:energy transducer TonB [Candidatus Eremiobacteraeota bacterium]MBV8283476.1 energy transducer TonB [Candidatus Eremiobacteraeota bacterium]MBV8333112.1 energy transducer TonB [Candidatus Eremiobacteraeota bacterium]MBV8423737.1 energy transducer TonB [Candidatus Eremiobacteraeota bacterium]MBV8584494.1 energy transducer TonB [Candidatus Eremiobacteraeota bacterium]
MKRNTGIVAVALAGVILATPLSALAQYSNEFTPAKLLKQGTTSASIAGSGTVVVQVQVNADGTHKAIKVIKTTNAGDNDAAMEIAQSSTYRPAHRGSTPVPAFYDFTLKFNGKSVASSQSEGGETGAVSPAAQQVATLIRQGQYAQAKSKAQVALLSSPGDDTLRQMLGIASFDAGDVTGAAAAFDRVGTIGKQFRPVAAAAFAAAAVSVADSNPSQAMTYAQKAVALDPGTNSKFALGVAQLANKQNAEALTTLKGVQQAAMNDPKFAKNAKVNIDARLMSAYLANNDTQDAQAVAQQIKQLDPTSTLPGRVLGNTYLKMGVDAATAKSYPDALKYFDQAVAVGDPDVQVTANVQAAFVIAKMDKPDWKQMQSYADKAVALKPDDPLANFADGVAQANLAVQSRDDSLKKKAVDTLNKADTLAKQAGMTSLSLQIESTIKSLNTPAAGGGGGE